MSALDWGWVGLAIALVVLALVLALSRLHDQPGEDHPAYSRPGDDKQFAQWDTVRLPPTTKPPGEST